MSNDQNRIAIFKNDKKEAGSKQPDYRLVGDFEGARIKGGIWMDKSKSGQVYMSGKLERDEGEQRQQQAAPQSNDDADFPF